MQKLKTSGQVDMFLIWCSKDWSDAKLRISKSSKKFLLVGVLAGQ